MASRTGRWTRMVTGVSLVVGGIAKGSGSGQVVALVGLVPLIEGAFDVCILGPLFGMPLKGAAIRRKMGVLGEDSLLPHPPPVASERPVFLH
ncbi:MAG: YgaP-like transmembrane domain [Cystobacter sp.]